MELRIVLRRLIREIMGKWKVVYFGAMIAIALFSGAFKVIASLLVRDLFVMAEKGVVYGLESLITKNLIFGGITLVLSVIATVIYNNEAKRAVSKLNQVVYMKSVKLPMAYYETHHTGEAMSKLMYDADRTGDIFGSKLRRLLMPIMMVVIYLVPMLYFCPQITMGLLVVHGLALLIHTFMIKGMKKISTVLSKANKEMTENITNILQGIETIKIFSVKQTMLLRYDHSNEDCVAAERKENGYWAILTAINTALDLLCSLVFLAIGIYYMEQGIVDLGSLTAIYILYGSFSWNFLQIGRYIPDLVNCLMNAKRVFEFIDTEEEPETYREASHKIEIKEIKEIEEEGNLATKRSYISMEHISFSYSKSDSKVLEDFNLAVEKGTSVAITGASGRGKSTLAKLLLGFYPADKGNIYIDGVSLEEMGLHKVRELIAYVPQEPYLYDVSIGENISYGNPKATKEQIIVAAKAAHAHEFIMKQPSGYATLAGERGAKLSGGEKQRIAIARAILKNAPILLLDEATSALDNESEYLVQEAIGKLMKNRTTLMIAHRPSTIATADIKVAI